MLNKCKILQMICQAKLINTCILILIIFAVLRCDHASLPLHEARVISYYFLNSFRTKNLSFPEYFPLH